MVNELFFRLFFLGYYLALIAIAVYFRRRGQRRGSMRTQGDAESKQREGRSRLGIRRIAGIGMITAAVLYVIYPPFMDYLHAPLPPIVRLLGVALGLTSLPLLVWVLDALGRQWSRNLQLQDEHQLITDGPYRLVRHPMYTVIFMAMSTVAIVSANWLMIVPAVVAMGVIYSRIPKEEAMLKEAFPGDYEGYMARTGRLLPRLRR
ncbi:MAG: isoprenylcysteine carboxylmethyltransferase family protein [Ardenticatenaceae bacterium]|nr:isoprenylcysteine carboxylmethyltransferase family protein [Ardenticatenaceae bacterium]